MLRWLSMPLNVCFQSNVNGRTNPENESYGSGTSPDYNGWKWILPCSVVLGAMAGTVHQTKELQLNVSTETQTQPNRRVPILSNSHGGYSFKIFAATPQKAKSCRLFAMSWRIYVILYQHLYSSSFLIYASFMWYHVIVLSVATNLLCINYWVILSYISKDIMFIIYIEFILLIFLFLFTSAVMIMWAWVKPQNFCTSWVSEVLWSLQTCSSLVCRNNKPLICLK